MFISKYYKHLTIYIYFNKFINNNNNNMLQSNKKTFMKQHNKRDGLAVIINPNLDQF